MISTQNLSKRFEDFVAVDSVNLTVDSGEVLALLGPNGAGKTTTIRMLTSILRPSSGWAKVAGYDVVNQAQQVRASVGVLTENHGLYNRMPALEYLQFFGSLYGIDKQTLDDKIQTLVARFDLERASTRRIGEYSKGMRQKLALARALLHDPPVLLLDEPTSAMDPESARLVRNMIQELRSSDRTVMICTHNLSEAEELADRIAIIRQGKIIEYGTAIELRRKLLGLPLYEIQFVDALNGFQMPAMEGVLNLEVGATWLRFTSDQPESANPRILKWLIDQGFEVVSLQEVPRGLENVYLEAVAANGGNP